MRILRRCSLAGCFILALSCFGQKQDWLPITPEDWAVKEVPGDPGAAAIQLYYAEHINDNIHYVSVYRRIKVLTDKGLQPHGPADVEILMRTDDSIADLKARTIHPDGTAIELTQKPFEKIVAKGRGLKYAAKTFTFPEATVGSILEYKYVLNLPFNRIYDVAWNVQHDLFTLKENLTMKPYSGSLVGFPHGFQVIALSSHLPKNLNPEKKSGGWSLDAENVAAFDKEGYMPPENSYRPEVIFYYGGNETNSDNYWKDLGRIAYEDTSRYMGERREVKEAATAAVGSETDPEKRLRKLYAKVQQIRNLSFERERTSEEEKKEHLKENGNVGDVLEHGYGWHNELNRLFVAMARANGFDASLVAATDRKERVFEKELMSTRQFTGELALVKINGSDLYLDPGTKFCPFGQLRWVNTSSQALKMDKKGGILILIPPETQDKAVIRRSVDAALDAAGALQGKVTIQFKGQEALERRLQALEADEAGKKKMLEDELKEWLPSGATVKFTAAQGWESSDDPLTATFTVEIPGYASLAGQRLLVPSYLFQSKQMDAFKHAERKYPVYFPYAFAEIDVVAIKTPAGYSMESVPEKQEAALRIAKYQSFSQFNGAQLVTQRGLLFNGIYLPLEMYPEIKGFFNKVQTGDEQQAVLQGGGVHAQKNN